MYVPDNVHPYYYLVKLSYEVNYSFISFQIFQYIPFAGHICCFSLL